MSDLPSRGATEWQWLRVEGLLSPTVEPIVGAFVDRELMTAAEWRETVDRGAITAVIEAVAARVDSEGVTGDFRAEDYTVRVVAAIGGTDEK